MKLPSISIVMPTKNSSETLGACLESIRSQRYPMDLIEIIIGDGGSSDQTKQIVQRFGASFVSVKERNKQGAEYNRAIAARKARHELLAVIDHDNILPHKNWLRHMVQPFLDDPTVVGVETIRYHHDPQDKVLGRYFALIGANDVLPFYLGKADRLSYIYDKPQQYGCFRKASIQEHDHYYVVDFRPDYIPTVGSNGFIIRRKLLFDHAKIHPDHYYHIDVNVDLIRKGFNRYAFVKDTLWHKTNERGFLDYVYRRKLFMEKYYVIQRATRRYSSYEQKDLHGLVWFIFISLTLVVPLYDAWRGYKKIPDRAWFLHPVMCFSLLVVYAWVIMRKSLGSLIYG